jgi:hypothetical protein
VGDLITLIADGPTDFGKDSDIILKLRVILRLGNLT